MRSPNPRRLELWAVRNDQQHAKASYPVHGSDRALPGSVGSIQCMSSKIINTGLWLLSASICVVEFFKRSLSALLRQQFEGLGSVHHSAARASEPRAQHVLARRETLRQQLIKLVELRLLRCRRALSPAARSS